MELERSQLLLYAITDRSWLRPGESLADAVEEVLRGGATILQLREKHLTGEALFREAQQVQQVCRNYGVPFLINDDVALCQALDADGVHVGQSDMAVTEARRRLGSGKLIGTSAHNPEEARKALADGADYIGCGAVFGSSTKTDATTLGVAGLRAIRQAVELPMVAIGGISRENVAQLKDSGADGIAVISALFAPSDKITATREMKVLAEQAVGR
jgi:thiamine-phosphate pyrophosphorylase